MNQNDGIILENLTDIVVPFNVRFPFPIDPRQFFSNIEEAEKAAENAVEIEVLRDEENVRGVILPDQEHGGADTVYYFGEPIVVVNEDKTTGSMYIIVKTYDDNTDTTKGKLLEIGKSLLENYYTKEQTDEEIRSNILSYIGELDVDTINDFITTKTVDECCKPVNLNGIYIRGLKEIDGKISLDDELKLIVAFDPYAPYNENTNPIATKNSVKNEVVLLTKELSERIDNVEEVTSILFESIVNTEEYVVKLGNSLNLVRDSETGIFEVSMFDYAGKEVNEYRIENDAVRGLTFRIIPKYDSVDFIIIKHLETGVEERYEPNEELYIYNWEEEINQDSSFEIEVHAMDKVGIKFIKTFNKNIYFILPSGYGVMNIVEYNEVKYACTETAQKAFTHAYDKNGLDYIDCYKAYLMNKEQYEALLYGQNTSIVKVARTQGETFETIANEGFDIDKRFFILTYLPTSIYLCIVKDDPCRIKEFKQTFVP